MSSCPFFACNNVFLNDECRKDIERYFYCKDTGTQPYPGAYGETPKIWVDKFYIIRHAVQIKQDILTEKAKAKHGNK